MDTRDKDIDIVIAGHVCLDLIPEFIYRTENAAILFRPGSLINVGKIAFSAGGPVANTGIAMKLFGNRVHFIAKIGHDRIGTITKSMLDTYGDTGGIVVSKKHNSSYSIVLSPIGQDRVFLHYAGTNDYFGYSDIDFKMVNRSRVFHLGYPPLMKRLYNNNGRELLKIFKKAKENNVITSLDMSLPDCDSESGRVDWRKLLKAALRYVDLFMPSVEESFYFLHPKEYMALKSRHASEELIEYIATDTYSTLAREFLSFGCKMIGIKTAHRGWYFKTAAKDRLADIGSVVELDMDNWCDREVWCPAFEAEEIKSATGAGDTSIAGFLSSMLRGNKLEECLKYANGAGNQCLTQLDAVSGLTGWEGLKRMLGEKGIIQFSLKGGHWEWEKRKKIWERK